MEIAAQVDTSNSDFKTEKTNPQAKITGVHESLLQECEKDIIWYRDNFFGKSHSNFLATESPKGPLAISVVREDSHFKVLVRSTTGSERLVVQTSSIPTMFLRKLLGLGPSLKEVLIASASPNVLPSLDYIKLCKDPSVPSDLLAMEERQVIRSYKFGLCNLAPGECTEDAFFKHSYDKASPAYKNFLSFLGERIELKGWKGYKAGLDVTSNQTGTHSYYTKWQGYEIMFHVSSLLPYMDNAPQQLERKRHIGNDIVVVVFQESDLPFQFSSITSKQNHIFAFIKPQKNVAGSNGGVTDGYSLTLVNKNGVPIYGPEIPEPAYFEKNAVSRDFLLHKLVNAERASYRAPSFAPKISRTRSVLLYDLAERFLAK